LSELLGIAGPFGEILAQDSGGEGAPVVLLHGNSASSHAFERQLQGPLGRTHRLIAFDLMGHGASANAADPAAYRLPGHARTLLALVEALHLEEAVFVGWSLGGHILLEAAPDLPRAKGLLIFGTPPVRIPPAMDRAFLPNPAMGAAFSADITPEQAEAFVAAQFAPGFTDIPGFFLEDVLRTDGRARAGVAASVEPGAARDEVEVVAALKIPLAILHGEHDQLINGDYFASLTAPTLWRDGVQTIAQAGHTPQWETPAAFDAAVTAFARDCGLRY
jgi:pimeloyl-ACP methyl ester carboxylesterase